MSEKAMEHRKQEDLVKMVVTSDPELSNYQAIAKAASIQGNVTQNALWNRLKNKQLVSLELAKIRDAHKEHHTRHTFPLAQRALDVALKDKSMPFNDKFKAVKLAYDKELSDQNIPLQPQTINIKSLQAVINNNLKSEG